jgi:hypothetical protein
MGGPPQSCAAHAHESGAPAHGLGVQEKKSPAPPCFSTQISPELHMLPLHMGPTGSHGIAVTCHCVVSGSHVAETMPSGEHWSQVHDGGWAQHEEPSGGGLLGQGKRGHPSGVSMVHAPLLQIATVPQQPSG